MISGMILYSSRERRVVVIEEGWLRYCADKHLKVTCVGNISALWDISLSLGWLRAMLKQEIQGLIPVVDKVHLSDPKLLRFEHL